jgi:murein DD-endopeptidase MepM/ murein hydrolase activator NlpD
MPCSRSALVGWYVIISAALAVADRTCGQPDAERLQPDRCYRGVAVTSSSLGKEITAREILDFVDTCELNLVVIDYGWITYHWPRTDQQQMRDLVDRLQAAGVQVGAMYRPRVMNPAEADVHFAVAADGTIPQHHNELCLAYEDSVQWGATWGRRILEAQPKISRIILYNLRTPCHCPQCRGGRGRQHAEAFIERCRELWREIRADVEIGHVGVTDEYARQVDFLCPFLSVNRQGDRPPGIRSLVSGVRAIAMRYDDKPVIPLAKTCWAAATNNTTEDVVEAIQRSTKGNVGFILWYYEWLFHPERARYEGKALVEALGGDWGVMEPHLTHDRANAESAVLRNHPLAWIYFESAESTQGRGPVLGLASGREVREIPVSHDTCLISYMPDRSGHQDPRLAIQLSDANRALLHFDLPRLRKGARLDRAVLVLDMKNSQHRVVAPFDLAVHAVTEPWDEQTTTWRNQPAFLEEPALLIGVQPPPRMLRLDVTDLVRAWLTGRLANNGLLLKIASPPSVSAPAAGRADPSPPTLTFPFDEKRIEKLPWPHQAPNLAPDEIDKLNRDVWIINDFPLYQADEAGDWRYFHGALDIVLDNGTKIYAMKDGWVKSTRHSGIIIADAEGDEPCYGWSYIHLGDHQVREGQFVAKGTFIGRVNFKGLPHIHLAKVFSEGAWWPSWQYISIPNGHFTYVDEDPPVIAEPLYFFANNTDTMVRPDGDGRIVLRGEVDIVVGMREVGHYAHGKENGFGDRLGVTRMNYEIRRIDEHAGFPPRRFRSFDFSLLRIRKGEGRSYGTELTKVVFKHWKLFDIPRHTGDAMLSFYVITNCAGDEPPRELSLKDRDHCWNTAERTRDGRRVYPEGEYEITVIACDFDGHEARRSTRVTVRNDAP